MGWRTLQFERLSVCERSTNTGSGLCGCNADVLLYYWHCLWTSGGLPVVSQIFLEMDVLEKQDGAVVGVFWLPCTLNAHLRLQP